MDSTSHPYLNRFAETCQPNYGHPIMANAAIGQGCIKLGSTNAAKVPGLIDGAIFISSSSS
jgi:hypothetical protein